ncbi:ATP-binding protein [Xenorhabdus bovienii]|uniref:ATP-binding protein n=1 Tax=Xenorhabdus bovienii TaxID=40576 RepID=UPI001EE0A760|nr:ATP-binding protein [Xenorhabdus bovienii]MCG3464073.1 ATP-binding protein [Xenorhabdus bovienii]
MKTTSDHLDKIAKDTPIKALSELIWNSFDAKSTNVKVHFIDNGLGSIDRITVTDNGDGIEHSKLDSLFGSLGDSWKKPAKRSDGYTYMVKTGRDVLSHSLWGIKLNGILSIRKEMNFVSIK